MYNYKKATINTMECKNCCLLLFKPEYELRFHNRMFNAYLEFKKVKCYIISYCGISGVESLARDAFISSEVISCFCSLPAK